MRIFSLLTILGLVLAPIAATADQPAAPDASKPLLSLEELRKKYADPAGHIANIDGVDVYYKDEGKGPAILLVHGSVSTLKTYDYIAPKLTDHYRVIRYDIPPLGLSGSISDAAAAALKPEDLAAKLLEKLGVKSVTAVGVSSGGTTCMFLAAKYPDLVTRLILSNTPSDPVDTSHLKPSKEFDDAQKEAKETHFQSQHFWDLFLSYFAGDPARMTPAIKAQYYDFNRRVPEKNPLALIGVVANHELATAAMAQVKAPTLLVWGARDPLLIPPTADILAGYLKNTTVSKIFLPDVGHYPPLEAPERFAQIIRMYIEAVTPQL